MAELDPITTEVIRNALQSTAEEMGAALARTAYSVNIRDRKDFSTAAYTAAGDLVAQAEHIPLHLGLMPSVVRAVLGEHPIARLHPGDVLVTNDPFLTGSHLMDICVITPVYQEGRPVGVVASMGHHSDVGGYAPGSAALGVSEVHQEGLRIPPLLLQREGVVDEGLLRLFSANSRSGVELRGDLIAQLASNRVGERRLLALADRYGVVALESYLEAIIEYSARRLRAALRQMPEGSYSFEDHIEGDGFTEGLIPIRVALRRLGDGLLIDFEGTSPQVRGPLNAARPGALACCYFAVKAVFDPDLPSNEGIARVVDVRTPEGSFVNARYPAAVALFNSISSQKIVDALLGALHQAVPHQVMAACTGSMNALLVGGPNPATGRMFTYVETYGGGQGAMFDQDGMDGVHTNMTNTRNTPVEAIELAYPLLVRHYSLVPDSEGAGRFRGGLGLSRALEVLGEETVVTVHTDRCRTRPWGLEGGRPAGGSACLLETPDGQVTAMPSKATVKVVRGSVVTLRTAGGGGWGDPRERDPEAVARDLRAGLITPQGARDAYGPVSHEEPGEKARRRES